MSASEFSKVYKVVEKETGEIYSAEISSMKINKFSPNEFQNLKLTFFPNLIIHPSPT